MGNGDTHSSARLQARRSQVGDGEVALGLDALVVVVTLAIHVERRHNAEPASLAPGLTPAISA